jgi:DNA-binding response OmpR family regulator
VKILLVAEDERLLELLAFLVQCDGCQPMLAYDGSSGLQYVTKPFGFRELLARIEAVLRRTRGARAAEPRTPIQSNHLSPLLRRPILMDRQLRTATSPAATEYFSRPTRSVEDLP